MPSRLPTLAPHQRPTDPRPAPSRRGYGRDWQRARLHKLACTPFCESPGCEAPATEVDHVISLARGGTHDPSNLRSLCKPCHSRKTYTVDGGLGRPKGAA